MVAGRLEFFLKSKEVHRKIFRVSALYGDVPRSILFQYMT